MPAAGNSNHVPGITSLHVERTKNDGAETKSRGLFSSVFAESRPRHERNHEMIRKWDADLKTEGFFIPLKGNSTAEPNVRGPPPVRKHPEKVNNPIYKQLIKAR